MNGLWIYARFGWVTYQERKKRELVSIHVRFRWVNYQSIKTKKQKTKERIETSLELVSVKESHIG